MKIPFTKMQGLGNDFVVIDATKSLFNLNAEQIKAMADRRLGIGFDQLLIIENPNDPDVDFNYRIFNADASEVAQCGNGARCIARYIKENGLSNKNKFVLQTINTRLNAEWENNSIRVDMSIPIFEPKKIPFITPQLQKKYILDLKNQRIEFGAVNLGNPHIVISVENFDLEQIHNIGSELAKHPCFPEGINVGFMKIIHSSLIHLRVYERGVGETLACGSGACAAMVIGRNNGLLDQQVIVSQLGGDLEIEWQNSKAPVKMKGPAEFVFRGEWLVK